MKKRMLALAVMSTVFSVGFVMSANASHIAGTYQNNRVLLNDGRVANIVMLNRNRLSKPIIQLMDGSCIDLSTQPDLHIQSVL